MSNDGPKQKHSLYLEAFDRSISFGILNSNLQYDVKWMTQLNTCKEKT